MNSLDNLDNLAAVAGVAKNAISQVGSNELVTAVIWGGAGIFLFLFPFVYYAKKFYADQRQDGKSTFEVIATAFTLQIVATCVISVGAYFSNQMTASGTAYDAKSSIRLFFTGNKNTTSTTGTSKLWEVWKPLADIQTGSLTTSQEGGIKAGTSVIAYYLSLLLFFTFIFLPMLIFIYPIFYFIRNNNEQSSNGNTQAIWAKLTNVFFIYIGIVLAFYLHQSIANGYVSVFGEINGFSFWGMTQEAWKEIF